MVAYPSHVIKRNGNEKAFCFDGCVIIVYVQVESIHQYIESMKSAYLANQRRLGDGSDPFLEADRRETAKQEAAAKRAHPTLHLPANSQPSTQVAGLLAAPGSASLQTSGAMLAASSGSFSTPSSAPSLSMSSSSLFATPSGSAPTSSLFGPAGATPQTSASPLFGSSAPSFGSAAAAGGSLFSTPFASGTQLFCDPYYFYSTLKFNKRC